MRAQVETSPPARERLWSLAALAGVVCLLATSCSKKPVAVAAPSSLGPAAPPAAAAPAPVDSDHDGLFVLGTGDEVTIKVFNLPQLDETVRIRPDGRMSVQLVDDLQVAGLTTRALDDLLTERYAEFFKDPQVTVIVRDFASLRVYVGGEVVQPGPINLKGKLTALAAVIQAGGLRATAKPDSLILLRDSGTKEPILRQINLKLVLENREPDIPLQAYDVVYVPMKKIAKVDRFVDQYIRQLLPISLTGGFTYILGSRTVQVVP